MDLSRPLQSLLGKTESRIIVALERIAGGMTGRQIARVINSPSPAYILTVLKKLQKIGVIKAKGIGNAILYEVNREHLLWPSIEAILQTPDVLMTKLQTLVSSSSIPEATVWLFGSTVRKQSTIDSDLDLVLLVPDVTPVEEMNELHAQLGRCGQLWTGNDTTVYSLTHSDLLYRMRAQDPLIDSWVKEAKSIIGPSIQELLEELNEQDQKSRSG